MKPTALSALLACALAPAFVSAAPGVPDELASTRFSGPDITPCPACLCAAPTGEVFVGVDLNGSLGKGPGKGRIVRLIDKDNDGKADAHTVYAEIDNPRGLISVGKKLFVLHTVIPKDTGKLEAMHLSVLEDADWDGKADGEPKRLISNISVAKHNQDRGADHTTNGIQLGIDGWIYVAVGDFGYVDATGADGTKLTMLGGGVVRVRPDGSEFEVYTHGLRNIYDIAIDPLMNIFTRGNTNDGGGWNVRFIHHIQTGEYGYPVLFKNFTSEMLPALQDLGGGSGTGALYFQEPGWPAKYSDVPMMCDWGRSQLYIHRLEPDGPSFTQAPEDFLKIAQISDVEVDGSGRLYAAAWDGAGYKGSEGKGYVDRIVPAGWSYRAFPEVAKADAKALVAMLRSDSATARRTASQELISRPDAANAVAAVAVDSSASLYARVAAIFTYKQMLGEKAAPGLLKLAGDKAVREWAIRALTDRKTQLAGLNKDLFVAALKDENPRVQVAAAVALGRLGDATAADALLAVANPPGSAGGEAPEEDNAPAFATEPFSGYDTVPVEVDVTGWDEMFLTVTDGGDGSGEDHAAWFNPVFVNDAGKELKLSTLKWKKAESEWGKIGFGTSAASQPLKTGDGKDAPDGLGTHAYSVIVFDVPKGAVTFRADAGIASTSKAKGKIQFMVSRKPVAAAAAGGEGPHATPNSPIILPHIAVKALVDLQAVDACVEALGGPDTAGALWALRKMHDAKGVDGLISACGSTAGEGHRTSILAALIRLYQKEAPYDGSWWWSTRPDTRGPYYKPITWEASEKIADFVKAQYAAADGDMKAWIARQCAKNRAEIPGIEMAVASSTGKGRKKKDEPKVDLEKIAAMKKGEVGKMSIEDVMLALDKVKGDRAKGEKLFTQQGCIACHTTSKDQPLKGPYMGQVGAILTRDQIAESILKPSASISQGFATNLVTTKDGKAIMGFVSAQSADQIELRDIAGQVHTIKTADIKAQVEQEISMMPPGLAAALSLEDFASLVTYLQSMKQ